MPTAMANSCYFHPISTLFPVYIGLQAPSAATYGILLLPMATQQGPRAANEILARQRLKGNPNPLHHLIMAMFYVQEKNLGIAKAHVRQGERLIRQLRATLEHYPEKRYLGLVKC
jgi:hypothetical protein